MDFINTLTTANSTFGNVLSGILSSAIFLIVLSLLKPRLKIGDKIAVHLNHDPVNNKDLYSIKVVNRSLLFKIYDIQVRAWTARVESSINADDISYEQIHLRKANQWVIHRLCFKHLFQDILQNDRRLESRTNYAAQFSTYDDLRSMITMRNYITIEVIAKHSLTGFTRVLSKNYKHSSNIVEGSFYSGNSCKIKP